MRTASNGCGAPTLQAAEGECALLTKLLPWIGVVFAIVALGTRDGWRPKSPSDGAEPATSFSETLVAAIAAALALAAGWYFASNFEGAWPAAIGFAVGLAFATLADGISRSLFGRVSSAVGPLALGVAAAGVCNFMTPLGLEWAQLGMGFGLGFGAWLFGRGEQEGRDWPASVAIAGLAVLMADILGRRASGGHASHTGLTLGIAAGAIGIAVAFARTKAAPKDPVFGRWGIWLASALLVGAGWLVATRYVWIGDVWRVFGGAVLVGAAVNWLLPERGPRSTFGFAISALVWIGVGTLAFGFLRGYGMAVALLGGALALSLAGNRAGMLSLGPLAALVGYRIFREMHEAASKALDIGQHYGFIGVMVGAIVILLAMEFRAALPSRTTSAAWAKGLAGLVIASTPFFATALLAEKGFVGLLGGIGIGAALVGTMGRRAELATALQAGLALLMCAGFGWFEKVYGLTRGEKVSVLLWGAPALFVVIALLALMTRGASAGGGEASPQPSGETS
jgi:hypothetical protein